MENQNSSNFMLYLMMILCTTLAVMNSLEIYRMINLWKIALGLKLDYFNDCVKPQYILKSFFCFFSFFASFSALLLTMALVINCIFFKRKLIESYLKLIHYIFGPLLLISSILAFFNWNDIAFICYEGVNYKFFSISNASSILFCFLVGGFITLTAEFYTTMTLYSDTITRQANGSKTLYSLFWYVSFKLKNTSNIDNPNNNSNNNSNNQTNSN